MYKNLIYLFLTLGVVSNLAAQSFWTKQDKSQISLRNGDQRTVIPEKYEVFQLDKAGLRDYLSNAPMEFSTKKGITLEIPMPNGRTELFEVFESPIMQAGIAAKYSSIKTYKAVGITDRSKNLRFSLADNGFYAAINSFDGEKYIDPYSEKNTTDYIVYDVKDHHSDIYKNTPMCGVDHEIRTQNHLFNPSSSRAGLVELRVLKLAMACTGEWGQVARRGTVEKCMADITVMVNRMNSIYEKEMAMRFVIIDNNDKLISVNPDTDMYDNSDQGKVILPTNTGVISKLGISSSSYDIGHVLSICFDIGGVAQGGSACQSNKGNGVTCNNDNDLTNIVTRVMAHEVGHQFDASHTWNICQPNDASIDAQRAGSYAYEPGSGTTIMSYAGSCSSDNVASDNDDYFHVASLDQMYAKTNSGGNAFACSDKVATTNHYPVIQVPSRSFVIPASTPFELEGTATDEDGDVLTYCWEQYDLGPKVALGTNGAEGPLFRSIKPSTSGYRSFPKLTSLLSGTADKTEVLPNVSRKMKFRLTVRDNSGQAGGVQWAEYNVEFSDNSGPLAITYPISAEKFKVGDKVTVTWDVANTNQAPVNCQSVNIYGSYSGAVKNGDTNLIPLALNVPNDGSQEVTIPNKTSNLFRILIKAADNIFMATHKNLIKIEAPISPSIYFETSQSSLNICQPDQGVLDITTTALAGFVGDIVFDIPSNLPAGLVAKFDNNSVAAGNTNKLTLNTNDIKGNLSGEFVIRAIASGVDTVERIIFYNIVGGDIQDLQILEPNSGQTNVSESPNFVWYPKPDASYYEFSLSTNPNFIGGNVLYSTTLADTAFRLPTILNKSTIYYWRVRAVNSCKNGEWSKVSAFSTAVSSCKTYESGVQSIIITTAGTPTVELPLNIPDQGIISDLNIKLIKAEHAKLADIVAYLVAPSGKEALLWSKQCAAQQNINVGLDDQSPNFFTCPINTGKVYRTHIANGAQKLEIFNGEQMNGTWKLRLEDKQSGSGGKLQELNLEICANIALESPVIEQNELLRLVPKGQAFITNQQLLATDKDNSAAQLTYTLVDMPVNGKLTLNGLELTVGSKFTQADINNSILKYESIYESNSTDSFSFTINDGQGGWINITNFEIYINTSVSVQDINLSQDVYVFPNPSTSDINIVLSGKAISFINYLLTDLSGRSILTGSISGNSAVVNLSNIANGVYMIRLTDGKRTVSKKLVKI